MYPDSITRSCATTPRFCTLIPSAVHVSISILPIRPEQSWSSRIASSTVLGMVTLTRSMSTGPLQTKGWSWSTIEFVGEAGGGLGWPRHQLAVPPDAVAVIGDDTVLTRAAVDSVGLSVPGEDSVIAATRGDDIQALSAGDRVVSTEAVDEVTASVAVDAVGYRRASEDVAALGTLDHATGRLAADAHSSADSDEDRRAHKHGESKPSPRPFDSVCFRHSPYRL